jgi:hypothetical protein
MIVGEADLSGLDLSAAKTGADIQRLIRDHLQGLGLAEPSKGIAHLSEAPTVNEIEELIGVAFNADRPKLARDIFKRRAQWSNGNDLAYAALLQTWEHDHHLVSGNGWRDDLAYVRAMRRVAPDAARCGPLQVFRVSISVEN